MADTAQVRANRPLDAIVFDGKPVLVETTKGQRPATPVFGADVFRDEFVRALLQHGTAERYVFFARDFRQTLIPRHDVSLNGRTTSANPGSIEAVRALDRVVLLSFRPHP